MRHFINLFLISILFVSNSTICKEMFNVKLTSMWQQINKNSKTTRKFGDKNIHYGNIIIRKQTPRPARMKRIILLWKAHNEKRIPQIIGSLYKFSKMKKLLTTEKNVICDSFWDKKKQQMVFEFEEELQLNPFNEFSIVLTIPNSEEKNLRSGHFEFEKKSLPHVLNFIKI